MTVPPALRDRPPAGPGWSDWIAGLPRALARLLADWSLELEGELVGGNLALVAPVRTADGVPAMLKLGWPHSEAAYEHLALQAWHGDGAVRLLRADPLRWALLLERAAYADLRGVPDREACEIVGGLYGRLHRPPLPQLDRLSTSARRWAGQLGALRDHPAVPRRLADQAAGLARAFAEDPGCDTHLLHTDLHYANVLAAEREPWLVIDPKPLAGDPHYEIAPLLWNRWAEAAAAANLRSALLDRLYAVVDAAGLDEDRTKDWVVVRALVNVAEAIDSGEPEPDWITRSIVLAKAAQPGS